MDFLSTLQELYNFFTVSTHRWEILRQHTSLRLKSLSQTRWSARHDACYTPEKECPGIIVALNIIGEKKDEKRFSDYEKKEKALSGVQNYYHYDTRRKKIRKLQVDESRENERTALSGEENFRTNVYYPILDTLSVQLTGRKRANQTGPRAAKSLIRH